MFLHLHSSLVVVVVWMQSLYRKFCCQGLLPNPNPNPNPIIKVLVRRPLVKRGRFHPKALIGNVLYVLWSLYLYCFAYLLSNSLVTFNALNIFVCLKKTTCFRKRYCVFGALCLSSCDSAKWSISIRCTISESVLRAFIERLVFLRRLICPVCSWHYQNKPNELTERDSSGLL